MTHGQPSIVSKVALDAIPGLLKEFVETKFSVEDGRTHPSRSTSRLQLCHECKFYQHSAHGAAILHDDEDIQLTRASMAMCQP